MNKYVLTQNTVLKMTRIKNDINSVSNLKKNFFIYFRGLFEMFSDKTILITGGTGSFGHNFTRRVLNEFNQKKTVYFKIN